MARPMRCRRICCEPKYDSFSPCGTKNTESVLLTVDEFESVRLIDYERRTHEQCARQMGVSRTTVSEMYERAAQRLPTAWSMAKHCIFPAEIIRSVTVLQKSAAAKHATGQNIRQKLPEKERMT